MIGPHVHMGPIKKVKLEKVLQIPELNIKVCCNKVVKVWEGQVIKGSNIEEIVGILKLRSGWEGDHFKLGTTILMIRLTFKTSSFCVSIIIFSNSSGLPPTFLHLFFLVFAPFVLVEHK